MRRLGVALAILGFGASAAVIGSAQDAGASNHPSYPLGHANSCRVDYHKRIRLHWVRVVGRRVERRYIACVYMAPKPSPTTTTTTAPPSTTESFTPLLTATEVPFLSSPTEIYFDINWDVSDLPDAEGCPSIGLGTLTFSFPQNPVSYPAVALNLYLGWPLCYANYFEVTFAAPTNGSVAGVMDYSGGSYQADNGVTVVLEPEVIYFTLS